MKNITFEVSAELLHVMPHPRPANKFVPGWYKKIATYKPCAVSKSLELPKPTIKACTPVRDYMTSGYIIPAWSDVHIVQDKDGLLCDALGSDFPFVHLSSHGVEQIKPSPLESVTDGQKVFKLNCPWNIKTSKGYSTLFFSPFYHNTDLTILPAVVDTDIYEDNINFPFLVSPKGCLIKQGTPLIQAVPIKRETWNHAVKAGEDRTKLGRLKNILSPSFYTNKVWTKKNYR